MGNVVVCLSFVQAAQALNVSKRTLQRWVTRGILKYVQITPHGKRLIRTADIDALLTSHQRILPQNDLDRMVNEAMHELGEQRTQNGRKAASNKQHGELAPAGNPHRA